MDKAIAKMAGHHIVCGDTAATWHVTEELTRTRRGIVVVVPTDEALAHIRSRLGDVAAVVGDASDDEILKTAGIERAVGIVFAMASDKDNVIGVLTARRLAPSARPRSGPNRSAIHPCQRQPLGATIAATTQRLLRAPSGQLRARPERKRPWPTMRPSPG